MVAVMIAGLIAFVILYWIVAAIDGLDDELAERERGMRGE